MSKTTHKFDPDWVIAPGETLQDWIDEHKLTVSMVATICGRMPVKMMEGVLAGTEKITPIMAEAIAHGTGIPTSFWINHERLYRSGLAAGKKRWNT